MTQWRAGDEVWVHAKSWTTGHVRSNGSEREKQMLSRDAPADSGNETIEAYQDGVLARCVGLSRGGRADRQQVAASELVGTGRCCHLGSDSIFFESHCRLGLQSSAQFLDGRAREVGLKGTRVSDKPKTSCHSAAKRSNKGRDRRRLAKQKMHCATQRGSNRPSVHG